MITLVKKYCKDFTKIENYEKAINDTTQTWEVHHRLETHNSDGERRLVDLSRKELIALDMYFDRPPEELIFLTNAEHMSLHKKGRSPWCAGKRCPQLSEALKGHSVSEEARKKMSKAKKGKKLSEEHKRKLSAVRKGKKRSEETRKRMSDALKGKSFSEEHKAKLSKAFRGRHWFNNGTISVSRFECPEGFVPGRLNY